MKIRTLFLKAFGPFTDAVLDFSGPANLHLVYGPNEAGKSSALRAMTDLRYGIAPRSRDDFVHEFKSLLLAGCFEDGAGRPVGLARRKGNKDPLMAADPATGAPLAGSPLSPIPPEVVLALTGGVAREQFDTMYGLNSRHLRKGGQMLVQGEGELGAALFEASTGSAGIKQMLQTLQADARHYFVPKGQLPVLNEAARQLEEARQSYRQAVTKPDAWKALKRSHDEAQASLAEVRQQLAGQRRRVEELTELRAVEPLLRQLDLAERQWREASGHVTLPADARESRLAAIADQTRSQHAVAEADEVIAVCRHRLLALKIDPVLLSYGPAIDRLQADMGAVDRQRDLRRKLQTATDAEAGLLGLRAQRMLTGSQAVTDLDTFFRHTPSSADQAGLLQALEAHQELNFEMQHLQARLASDGDKLAQLQHAAVDQPAPRLHDALARALAQAQALGGAQQRQADARVGLDAEQRKLDGLLRDLRLQSAEQLVLSGWLASAEIDAWERERSELLGHAVLLARQFEQLQADLALQQRRRLVLAAAGEVVTADTLRQARSLREEGWQAVRAVFIDPGAGADPSRSGAPSGLPARFEQRQAESDRQADLLREGAKRAAEVAECGQRIAATGQALASLALTQDQQVAGLALLDARWQAALPRLGIAVQTPAGVREWQALRKTALDGHERLVQATLAQALLTEQMAAAGQALSAALAALGQEPQASGLALEALICLGAAQDRLLVMQQAARERRQADLASLAQSMRSDQARAAGLLQSLTSSRSALDERAGRLFLAPGAAVTTFKARLAELQQWAHDFQMQSSQLQQLRQMQADNQAVADAAACLGQQLGEPLRQPVEAWLEGLAHGLLNSREAALTAAALELKEQEESTRRHRALAELDAARQRLEQLVRQAGVQHAGQLPDAEVRAEQRHAAKLRLQGLQQQLESTSRKSGPVLRQELASLDSAAIEMEKQICSARRDQLEAAEQAAIEAEQAARAALANIDTSGKAAEAKEEMEAAIARYRAGVRPWAQLKLAEALLGQALRRHREKAQGPVVALAGDYFRLMTGGRFERLVVDADSDPPLLLAQPAQGQPIEISALSEGTADQLYLALRLAALELQRKPDRVMPLVLDDVFMTADDERAAHMFGALAKFAAASQVLVFTHHHHLLVLAAGAVGNGRLKIHRLEASFADNLRGRKNS